MVAGTEGYDRFIPLFIQASQSLDFIEACADFIPFLPPEPARVLDIGSGAGQNASALAEMGFNVTAVEPMQAFLDAAKNTYQNVPVRWFKDCLPHLDCLACESDKFDFILINSVWHHLDEIECEQAIHRLSTIVKKGGKCAISLRNGPAGMGTRVYPTDVELTVRQFQENDFECLLILENQPSILKSKDSVKWSKVVVRKCE
ncbi:class I SAM-dependent methyltransferase [Aliikangiella coralliicola]|uniref:Class I SAM-dependent methyltransferase n=1 Tax=Aliikangiella coralliicola TaxID=2592383 RepID=A0A545UFI0_9GAMM|nr:class I SAM-dependent methyltransferase [Aliikangiella coralliicola]TQV88232.1 class I SAM-dependent methyltransferase [Aliikangiella coralliicola]